jgi:hypothetical protein
MTGRNVLLALLLSLILTFAIAVIYIFDPLIIVMITNREGSGIGATGGSLSIFLFIIEPALFIVIFAFLQRRSKRS